MIALVEVEPDNRILDTVICGEALSVLRGMPENSVDAIVTDPPAGIAFMGKEWDNPDTFPLRNRGKRYTGNGRETTAIEGFAKGVNFDSSKKARDNFIAFLTAVMREALRCLRPGGHALIWALPRTSHWTAMALEDAGFEVRDAIFHHFGSGFPKSTAIDKQIDKLRGAEREAITHDVVVPENLFEPERRGKVIVKAISQGGRSGGNNDFGIALASIPKEHDITAPATPEAAEWQGWGTALKPSTEIWWLVRKP